MESSISHTISLSEDEVSVVEEEEEEDAPLNDPVTRGISSFAEWKRMEKEADQDKDLGDVQMAAYNSPIFSTPGEKTASYTPTAKYQTSSFEFAAFIKETKESAEKDGPFVVLKNVSFSIPIKTRLDNNPFHRPVLAQRTLINDISFFMAPGTMTLLLGPPGCGKTTLIKYLAQRLPQGISKGEYLISNNPPNLSNHHRDTAYITQEDCHLAPLTVYETLMFSANCQMSQNCPQELKEERVQKTMELLGISHRANVVVGDALLRGVSGGEKRRLSIGIEIVKAPNMILLDEPTTGLDSQVSFQVMRRLKKLGILGQVPILAALLQPSYELFSLFDNVIILGEGEIVYFGPTGAALPYFQEIGFQCPIQENPADFLQNVLQNPQNYTRERGPDDRFPVISSTQDFVREYKSSVHFESVEEVLGRSADPPERPSLHYKNVARYPTSLLYQFKLCFQRDVRLGSRDRQIAKARVMKSIIFSLILGTLFWQLDDDQDGLRYRIAVIFFALVSANMAGIVTLSGLITKRETFIRQRDGMYYHPFPYLMSMILSDLPLTIVETFISTTIVWWMSGVLNEGAAYIYFVLTTFFLELFSLSVCRLIASISPNFETANSTTPAVLALFILFSGYMISVNNIPWVWKPLYYVSAMAYGFQGCMIAAFEGTTWMCKDDQLVPSEESPMFDLPYPEGYQGNQVCPITSGEQVLESIDISTDSEMKWYFWIPIISLVLLGNILTLWAMIKKSFDAPKSVQRVEDNNEEDTIQVATENQSSTISFHPVSLYFEDIYYSVPIVDGKVKKELKLLNGVSGYAEPGSLVALMGSSGAGKSTLLDVLADRKTYGTITGKITVNGRHRDRLFKQITGYVEQQDLHIETQTVREAIEFSATLRLPNDSYSQDQKLNFAQSVIEILDLLPLEDRILRTLSGEQKKRVTIGVEMAANPSLLFLDEPTSGLDSNGADRVMAAVSRISASGRTVICTIHQPSRKLFGLFSHLLLLKKGGEVSYFGRVGNDGDELKNYFEKFGFTCSPQKNPADFILEISGNNSIQTSTLYSESELCKQNIDYLKQKIDSVDAELPPLRGRYVTTFGQQLKENIIRRVKTWERSLEILKAQLTASIFIAILIGTLFFQLDNDQDGYSNRVSVLFFTVIFISLNSLSSIPSVMSCRPAFYREHSSATYQSPTFLIAQDLVNLPINLLVLLIYLIPTYWLAGLNSDPQRFLVYLLFCCVFSLQSSYFCQFVASVTADAAVANVIASGVTTFTSLFSGFLLPLNSAPVWWRWVYYISPTAYLLDSIVSNELHGEDYYCTEDQEVEVPIEGTNETKAACPITSGDKAMELYDFDYDHLTRNLIILVCLLAASQIGTHIGFRFARMIKR